MRSWAGRDITQRVEVGGAQFAPSTQGATMLADLDLLLIAVFCAADDFLPVRARNARRMVTDAEVVTLAVAQAIMGIPSDERFLAVARKRLGHLSPQLPRRPAYHKRRVRLAERIEALVRHFAAMSPGFYDDLVIVDSPPVECARSVETVRRSALGRGRPHRPRGGRRTRPLAPGGAHSPKAAARGRRSRRRRRRPPRCRRVRGDTGYRATLAARSPARGCWPA